MSHGNTASRRSGFTLVEMVIIAPIALLVITGFIALMVTMVGDVIASRSRNVMTYDIQSALNTIERDVRLSTEFLATSGTLPTPQGKNGATSAFESVAGDLILGGIATNKNPVDPTRSFIHYNSPFSCSDPTQVYQNRIFFITVMYTVRGNSLWRRTYVPAATGLCQSPWQVNTCAPGYVSSQTQCQATDSEILKNVKSFTVNYYTNPEDTVTLPLVAAPSASTIGVTIEAEQTSAGRTIASSSTGRSTKLSSREINLAPPSSPTVTGAPSGSEVVFSWPSVPTATAYIIKYNINGGSWVTATENSTENTFSIAAKRGATVSAKVLARNTTGTSADGTSNNSSVTLPLINVMPGFTQWTLSGGATYSATTGELTLGTNGVAESPVVRVDKPALIRTGGDMYATVASPNASLAPQGGYHVSIYYYGSDGVTPAQNTAGYTGNGCARPIALNAWQLNEDTCAFSGGPNVVYVKYLFFSNHAGYTSPNLRIKNPLLKLSD